MKDNEIYKQALRQLVQFCLWIIAARFTKGAALVLMAILGVAWAFNGKAGKALGMHVMITFMTVVNPHILANDGMMAGLGLRVGPMAIGLALALTEMSRKSGQRLPMGGLLVYLLFATVSSISGWSPIISYLKLINFTIFFLGVWLGTSAISKASGGVMHVRAVFLALAWFLVFGSIALYPFPGISTIQGLNQFADITDVALKNALIEEMVLSGGASLFCGVTFHSQTFAPLLVCTFAWVLCDMLFVEKHLRWPHITLLTCAFPFLYLTRSRVAFFSLIVLLSLIYSYVPRRIKVDGRVRRWLKTVLSGGAILLVLIAVISEIQNNTISRWVRKTEDVDSDSRTLTEAVTASRQGLMEMCLDDFKRNPMIGMGFQVASYTEQMAEGSKGLILSAPIEKGVLPVMVLGEAGSIGFTIFILFLISFYTGCGNRRLFITIVMMSILLAINMGEATFFSPGGVGGITWVICIVGGYVLDISLSVTQNGGSIGQKDYGGWW